MDTPFTATHALRLAKWATFAPELVALSCGDSKYGDAKSGLLTFQQIADGFRTTHVVRPDLTDEELKVKQERSDAWHAKRNKKPRKVERTRKDGDFISGAALKINKPALAMTPKERASVGVKEPARQSQPEELHQ